VLRSRHIRDGHSLPAYVCLCSRLAMRDVRTKDRARGYAQGACRVRSGNVSAEQTFPRGQYCACVGAASTGCRAVEACDMSAGAGAVRLIEHGLVHVCGRRTASTAVVATHMSCGAIEQEKYFRDADIVRLPGRDVAHVD
jgi:hypothetical protein